MAPSDNKNVSMMRTSAVAAEYAEARGLECCVARMNVWYGSAMNLSKGDVGRVDK